MSSSDEPGVAGEYEQVLIRTVRDPDGNEFSVQAAPAFGMAGPIFIGHYSEPSTGVRCFVW